MKAIILLIICILVTIQGYAQTIPKKIKLYNARIRTLEDKKLIKGTFYTFIDPIIYSFDFLKSFIESYFNFWFNKESS